MLLKVTTEEDLIFQLFQKLILLLLGNDKFQLSHCTEPNPFHVRAFRFTEKKVIKWKRRNKMHKTGK